MHCGKIALGVLVSIFNTKLRGYVIGQSWNIFLLVKSSVTLQWVCTLVLPRSIYIFFSSLPTLDGWQNWHALFL
jgi:hypothetical protein